MLYIIFSLLKLVVWFLSPDGLPLMQPSIHSLNCHGMSPRTGWLHINGYVLGLYSRSWVYLCVLVPVPHCINYCYYYSKSYYLRVMRFCFSISVVLALLDTTFPPDFRPNSPISIKKGLRIWLRLLLSIDQFGKSGHITVVFFFSR